MVTVAAAVGFGTALALAVLFAAGSIHKLRVLWSDEPDARAVMDAVLPPGPPSIMLACVATAEAVLVVVLVAVPIAGLLGGAAALLIYAQRLRRLNPDVPCPCFATSSATPIGAVIVRNRVLAFAALCAFVIAASSNEPIVYSDAVAFSLLILAAVAAAEAIERLRRFSTP